MNFSGIQPRFCLSNTPLWVLCLEQEGPFQVEGLLQPFLSAIFDKIPDIRALPKIPILFKFVIWLPFHIDYLKPNIENILFTETMADFGRVYSPNNATGLIRFFVSNECDISLLYDQFRFETFDYVDYPSFAVPVDIKIYSWRPINRFANTFKLIGIFDNAVWISLLFFISIISLLLKFSRESKFNFFTHFLNLFAILLFQENEIRVKRTSRRIFWSLWILSFFITSASFCSKLLSQLALPDTLRYFESLRDLIEFPDTLICIPAQTPIHYFFLSQASDLKMMILKQVLRLDGLFDISEVDPDTHLDNVVPGRRATIMDEQTLFAAVDLFGKCGEEYSVHSSKETMTALYTYFTRKGFKNPVSAKWNLMIQYYFEGGNFEMDFHFAQLRVPRCMASFQSVITSDYANLTVANIYFPLIMYMVGVLFCSVISFVGIYKILNGKRYRARRVYQR